MNAASISRIAFWGMCATVLRWMAATVAFEFRLGWPGSGLDWAKRIVGWGVELLLIRALVSLVRRYYSGAVHRTCERFGVAKANRA